MRALQLAAPVLALAAAATAEPRQHGNIVLDLPPEWTEGTSEDGTQIFFYDGPEERCSYCRIYLGTGAPVEGAIDAWLAAQSSRFVDEDDRDSVEVLTPAAVVGTDPRNLAMMGQTVDGDLQVLFAVQAGDRYEVFAFEGWGYDEEEVTRNMAFFQSDVTPLFDRFAYVSEGAPPLMPPAFRGELSGLWWGWHQGFTVGLDGIMMPEVQHRRIVFWTDGHFYDGTPPGGVRPFDPAAAAAAGDPNWGTYRESGGALALTFATGETEVLRADGQGEDRGWSDGDDVLRQVETLPDGSPLDGTLSSFFYTGFAPGSGIEGGVSSSSSTTFHPDGTYEGESFGGAFGNFTDGGGTTTGGFATDGGTTPTGGTYKVRDGLVVMRPADGSPTTAEIVHYAEGDIMVGDLFLEAE